MMGVYIKNMKMPGECLACDFCNPFAEEPYCRRLMRSTPTSTRLPDCPLGELPPHGDLIDRREAIIDANERAYDFWLSDDEVNSTIQFLNEQAAILPTEED